MNSTEKRIDKLKQEKKKVDENISKLKRNLPIFQDKLNLWKMKKSLLRSGLRDLALKT